MGLAAGQMILAIDRPYQPPEVPVIILGIILLVLGLLLKVSLLTWLGIILLVVGLVLMLLGTTGRAVGGRKHFF